MLDKVMRLRRATTVLLILAPLAALSGCATYPGARDSETVICPDSRTYDDSNAAGQAAARLSAKVGSHTNTGDDVSILRVRLAPVVLNSGKWAVGVKVDYRIADDAKPGKRSIAVELFDRSGTRIATASLALDVKRNKAAAHLALNVLLAVIGLAWTSFYWINRMNAEVWSCHDEAGRQRLKEDGVFHEPIPGGCACLVSLVGLIPLLYSIWMILIGVFG